ncbi:MAG TPA: carbohydrate ABC transporter permease [Streptosporangiaceae bacterium]|nr:carbohydrate ABC transporter permease [Streptosporangiaceae bacterium]
MAATTQAKIGWSVANVVTIVLVLIPLVWIISLSFKTPGSITDPTYFPVHWTWANYSGILTTATFLRPLLNSIGIGLIATFIAVVLASMAAYAVARLNFPGKQVLIGVSLLIAMFPAIALATPLFNIERILGLFNTWPGLIIPYIATGLPLGIYTLSAFFREIPWELEKAAKVDGATPFQAFVRVIAPLAAPGMVTTAILVFLFCWNEFLLAITLTATTAARTAPAALSFFTGNSQFAVPTGSISAAAVVITIPIIIFVLFFQRRIVAGLTAGAVKG